MATAAEGQTKQPTAPATRSFVIPGGRRRRKGRVGTRKAGKHGPCVLSREEISFPL